MKKLSFLFLCLALLILIHPLQAKAEQITYVDGDNTYAKVDGGKNAKGYFTLDPEAGH